jgi:hypothetical protein
MVLGGEVRRSRSIGVLIVEFIVLVTAVVLVVVVGIGQYPADGV